MPAHKPRPAGGGSEAVMAGFFKKLFGTAPPRKATIAPFGVEVSIPPGQTLLEAALAQGVAFPHNCTVGTCASCKCRLVTGSVDAITDFGYTLSREELQAGFILACQAVLKSDIAIEVESPGADAPAAERFAGRIKAVLPLTHDILSVTIALDRPIRYIAGQYANLTVAGIPARSYSFATGADRVGLREVTFFIRKVPGGAFTERLFAGGLDDAEIAVDGPHGMFYLRAGDTPIVCLAGGSGLAPVISVLQDARKTRVRRDCVLLFGARTQADLYGCEQIDEIRDNWGGNFTFVPILSHEPEDSGWTGRRGFVTAAIGEYLGSENRSVIQAYMCGPPPMIDAAITELTALGVPLSGIHYDKFTDASYTAKAAAS